MKKVTINKKTIVNWLINICVFLFIFSGWILYISSEIINEGKETSKINSDTRMLQDSLKSHKNISNTVAESENDAILSIFDDLMNENRTLRDSITYYSMFYRIVQRKYGFDYKFNCKDSANVKIYEGYITETFTAEESCEIVDSL